MTQEKKYWVRRYLVRPDREWGIFMFDSLGYLGIISSYGNYSYQWSDFGGDFVEFLCDIDTGYLTGKLDSPTHRLPSCDVEDQIREFIMEARKTGSLSKEDARREWDDVERFGFNSDIELNDWMCHTKLSEPWDWLRTQDYSPRLRFLCDKLWPRFIELIKGAEPSSRESLKHCLEES